MSRTVTALYDTKSEAEAARQRLQSAVDVDRINVVDRQEGLGGYHLSNDDRHLYNEGIRRGGALLCAEVDSHEDADRIVRALEETSSVDLEERQRSWRQDGWAPQQAAGLSTSGQAQGALGAAGGTVEEEHIPIVEEELKVGKREVERGGARVRSYVREIPVHEEVTLREEHVHVERRPVAEGAATVGTTASGATAAGSAAGAADMLRERTVEMVEKAEEAVVQKVAHVKEEVVVSKTAEEHTQVIDETLRRTEVEVDDSSAGRTGDRSAFGGFGGGKDDRGDR